MLGTYQRDEFGRGWDALGNEKHEDGESQQDGDPERNLLSGLGRQPEPEQTEHGQPETRADDVEQVVERSTSYDDGERDVRVRLDAASVADLVATDPDRQQLPLAAEDVVGQVDLSRTILDVDLHVIRGQQKCADRAWWNT